MTLCCRNLHPKERFDFGYIGFAMGDFLFEKGLQASTSRRAFLRSLTLAAVAGCFPLLGCERHRYIRPTAELDLGTVRDLLYSMVHVRIKSALVYRDGDGWRALSTRCSYDRCDLTLQTIETYRDQYLLCPCCRSEFDLMGHPHPGGKAAHELPWMTLSYRDGHIFGDPGKPVSESTHFTTPEIENAIHRLRERIKEEGVGDEVKIPEILMGQADGEPGRQFLEDDPELIHRLQMIK
ncbi:MAG: Rieske 2Fe-2S domain-containing protein [Bdellovibrionota bacterium]